MIGLIPLVWLNWAVIPVPHGITGIGLPEAVLGVILDESDDLYADEQIGMIAARLGFADELSKVLDSLGH